MRYIPRVLDYEAQVVISGESDGFLDVLRRSGVDADYWHVPLSARNSEGGIEVTALDRPVGKGVSLVISEFGGARLIGTLGTVVLVSDDIGTASCSRVVARGGRWDGVDQWLRDFRRESLELGIGRPTPRSKCTAAVSCRYRCQAEGYSQERREEKHSVL